MNPITPDAPVFCAAPRNFKVVVKNLKLPVAVSASATSSKTVVAKPASTKK